MAMFPFWRTDGEEELPPAIGAGSLILLEDGSSYLLLEDDSSKFLVER